MTKTRKRRERRERPPPYSLKYYLALARLSALSLSLARGFALSLSLPREFGGVVATGCLCDAVLGLVKRKELHGAILVSDGADPRSGNTATH